LTQAGWTSSKIAEAFGVRVDTVRLPARRFHRRRRRSLEDEGRARPGSGEESSGLARGHAVLEALVADRANWTIPRLRAEIEARESVRISRSQLSKALQKNVRWRPPRHMLKGRQIADPVERVGLRLQLRKRRGEAGDIVLLYGDESEALTHPYLARAWARSGADRPGRSRYWGRSIIGRAGSSLSRGHPNPWCSLLAHLALRRRSTSSPL